MIRYRCDKCGKDLGPGSDHFVVRIEAFAAASPLEITAEDVEKDHQAEIRQLVEQLSHTPLDEVEDQVFRAFRFDLCGPCHREYLRNPLPPA
ncbi:MAG: hypothetical protein JXA69_06810 [Phycisphaerae bacterium]|nr:hypothetical protein [Phycisphaerae bacterium]